MAEKGLVKKTKADIDRPYGPGWLLLEDQNNQLVVEDAHIVFRNFAGRKSQYNAEGDRNFCVIIPPEIAEMMIADNWNVKQLKSREDGVPGDYYIQVSLGYKGRPPKVFLRSSKGRNSVPQHRVEVLDFVDIGKADVIINPYRWDVNGKQGVKAYVKTLVITMNEDYLEQKYDTDRTLGDDGPIEGNLELPAGDDDQNPDEGLEGMDIVDAEIVEES